MGISELNIKLAELKNNLAKEQAVKSTNTRPENPGKPRYLRRQIARIHTIKKEKQKPAEVKQ
jgi:large subunit ribosomal protein L29